MLDLALKTSAGSSSREACKASRGERLACSSLDFLDLFLASAVRLILLSAIRLESAVV